MTNEMKKRRIRDHKISISKINQKLKYGELTEYRKERIAYHEQQIKELEKSLEEEKNE